MIARTEGQHHKGIRANCAYSGHGWVTRISYPVASSFAKVRIIPQLSIVRSIAHGNPQD